MLVFNLESGKNVRLKENMLLIELGTLKIVGAKN